MTGTPTHSTIRWDLDAIFPGASASPTFHEFLAALQRDVAELGRRVDGMEVPAGPEAFGPWRELVAALQDIVERVEEADAFVACLTAQDVADEQARILEGRVHQVAATLQAAEARLDPKLLAIPDPTWRALLADPPLDAVAFPLGERRELARAKLPPDQEALACDLAVDGYHAWGRLYDLVEGRMRIPVEQDGQTEYLSVPQAANRLESPSRPVREAVFARWEQAWAAEAPLLAAILNHLAGFRLSLYRRRGWHDVLYEPLRRNRLSRATLDAMWEAVETAAARLEPYLRRKSRLLGVDAPAWHDVSAPLAVHERRWGFDEAAAFVTEQFESFSPDMASLARRAFEGRWIEAEDRPGKRAGGFCTSFPIARQSRIFMTFAGMPANVETLAHELGHAFHHSVVEDLPPLVQHYPMSLAETASTFAELVVSEGALRKAESPHERVALLDRRLSAATDYLMNIRARFLFETAFYREREQGQVSVARLNALMEQAQKEAYRHALTSYHPHFWASKLHFYLTGHPFYNFPYTFGFLFSHGVYARARSEGSRFASTYVALLRDTGRMTVEELARRHLGADLTRRAFWDEACAAAVAPLDDFLRLTADGMPPEERGR